MWRGYMGGRHTDGTARFGLADAATVVASTGGRFVARHVVTQAIVWESELLGTGRVADMADVDGDGQAEVAAFTDERAYLLSQTTGAIVWTSPEGAFGRVGAVRIVDMNGDSVKDVYIDDASGAKTGAFSAAAYSFAAGLGSPVELWSRPLNASPPAINAGTDSILDLDGDGVPEVALASFDEMLIVRGDTGIPIASLTLPGSAGHPFSQAEAIAADLDNLPGKEILVVQPNGQVSGSHGPPALMAFKVNPAASQATHLWTKSSGSFEGEIVRAADIVADINGDGVHEVVASYRSPITGGIWVTEVLAGPTGNTMHSLPGVRFEGAADLNGNPGAEIVVAGPSGLAAFTAENGALEPVGAPLAGYRALSVVSADLRQRGETQRRIAVVERAGQPAQLIAGLPDGTVPYSDLASARSFVSAASLTLGPGGLQAGPAYKPLVGTITEALRADFATRPYEQIAMATTNGTVEVLDDSMVVTNGIVVVNDPPAGTQLGGAMQPRIGADGGPLIGVDPEGPFVLLPGAPQGLIAAKVTSASLVVPPHPKWINPGMGSPSIIPVGPGMFGPLVVGVEGNSLVAHQASSGQMVGSQNLGPGRAAGTPLPLNVVGQPAPLVGIDWRVEGVAIAQRAVSFASNTVVWSAPPFAFGGFYASGAGDLDGDGTSEWYYVTDVLHRRNAATGQLDTFPGLSTGYSIPMVADFMGSQAPDLLLQSGVTAPKLATNGLVQAWEGPLPEQMNVMAGTRVACASGPRFVTPAVQSPFLRAFDGATGALVGERVLAGGAVYTSVAAAAAAGARVGTLSNASSVADAGQFGPAVLVGSSDGFLYALHGCSMNLLWAKELGAPVAEPAIGNVDADGIVEVVVGAADGYIYGLDWPPLIAPGNMLLGGAGPDGSVAVAVGEDVFIQWSAVPGASEYEVALVDPDGRAIRSPAYQSAKGESAKVSLEGALAGRPYRVALRGRSGEAAGAEAFSGNIVIVDTAAPFATASGVSGAKAAVELSGKDDLALDHYLVRFREAGDPAAPLMLIGDDLLSGKEASASLALSLPEAARGKSIELVIDIVDSAGNVGREALPAFVGLNGEIQFETKAGPGVEPAGEVPGSSLIAGGGCSVTGPSTSRDAAALFALAGLGAALARRFRGRRGQ
jgi:MYXO-CTERM domain-containing protein